MSSVIGVWSRIESILSTSFPHVQLKDGATEAEVEKFSPSGFEAPSELKEFYLRHDMDEERFLLGLNFLSAENLPGWHSYPESMFDLGLETGCRSFFDNPQDDIDGEDYASGRAALIPFTGVDTHHLCVESRTDTRHEQHGRVIWMDIDSEQLIKVAPSISVLLAYCADDLVAGVYKWEDEGFDIDHPSGVSAIEHTVTRWTRSN